MSTTARAHAVTLEAVISLIDIAFATQNLRKLYLEYVPGELPAVEVLVGGPGRDEALLTEFILTPAGTRDLRVIGFDRGAWDDGRAGLWNEPAQSVAPSHRRLSENPQLEERSSAHPPLGMCGRRVQVRDLSTGDADWVASLLSEESRLGRWRHLPGSLNPNRLDDTLWEGVACQLAIERRSDGQPIGLAIGYRSDWRNRTIYVAVVVRSDMQGIGLAPEAAELLIDLLFRSYGYRKIFGESLMAGPGEKFRSGVGTALQLEGTLVGHIWSDDSFVDMGVFSVERNAWVHRPARFRMVTHMAATR